MSGTLAVSNLGKSYRRYARPWHRLCEWASGGRLVWHEAFWALHGITFSVPPGESVGIIGLNGAGKSTLLKILTGTTQPTEGQATGMSVRLTFSVAIRGSTRGPDPRRDTVDHPSLRLP